MLDALSWRDDTAFVAPYRIVSSEEEVESAFDEARASGNEGLIAKEPGSPYTPGRRGKSWVELKRALATLDVVVTGVERGHGRRNGVLSDYTFAVRASESDPTLLNVGKAYNGLTDQEIVELTERIMGITTQQLGRFHAVRPEVVLELTFDIVQKSARTMPGTRCGSHASCACATTSRRRRSIRCSGCASWPVRADAWRASDAGRRRRPASDLPHRCRLTASRRRRGLLLEQRRVGRVP